MSTSIVPAGLALADLQAAFQDYLLGQGDSIRSHLANGPRPSGACLLDVYRDGYALRLVEALTADFPGLVAMLGPGDFGAMARRYVAGHPSSHASLRWLGRHLAAFLESNAPWKDASALAEMARFEWALGEAWDATDSAPITADALVALPPDAWQTLSFDVVPSLRRIVLELEVPQAWQTRVQAVSGRLAVSAAADGPVTWAIWRADLVVQFRSLPPDEAAVLDRLMTGRNFPDLCEAVGDHADEQAAVARVAGLLRAWVDAGMLGAFQH